MPTVNRPNYLAVGSRGRGFAVPDAAANRDEALQAWFAASAVDALVTGMWPGFAPDKTPLPFITYTVTGNVPDNAMIPGLQPVDDVFITFYLRSGDISPIEVDAIFTAFVNAFDDAIIPITGFTTVRLDRVGGDRAKDADGGWVWVVQYKWHVQT